ncbi:hypothetical protein QLX08_000113 [Tetragonisca angustula]|uniref:Uncharacterized protein n=1 Tax=Tetragonisca angustula TaxID=166442 RepID=A0AAW1AKQ4_9HYME
MQQGSGGTYLSPIFSSTSNTVTITTSTSTFPYYEQSIFGRTPIVTTEITTSHGTHTYLANVDTMKQYNTQKRRAIYVDPQLIQHQEVTRQYIDTNMSDQELTWQPVKPKRNRDTVRSGNCTRKKQALHDTQNYNRFSELNNNEPMQEDEINENLNGNINKLQKQLLENLQYL